MAIWKKFSPPPTPWKFVGGGGAHHVIGQVVLYQMSLRLIYDQINACFEITLKFNAVFEKDLVRNIAW